MRERVVEEALVRAVRRRGGICPKWVSPGTDGVPDRIVILPPRHIAFVEVKAPGEKPRRLQIAVMKRIEKAGGRCFVIDRVEDVEELIGRITEETCG